MLRTRPARFALVSVGIWLLQLGLTALVVYEHWVMGDHALRWWEMAAVGASLVLGILLLAQLPRALQWRPRLSARPSAEVSAERRRIARDLHDHLGSHLVCAMALVNSRPSRDLEVLSLLEQSMLHLRLVVDSMDGAGQPLADRLARLRHRMQPVLEQRGIAMSWEVLVPPGTPPLPPEAAAQLLAIAQEAISNVLQHSMASRAVLRVCYFPDPQAWAMEIRDNGRGTRALQEPGHAGGGFGTQGMQRRAVMAGGLLRTVQMPGRGTSVLVVVPGHAPGALLRDPA